MAAAVAFEAFEAAAVSEMSRELELAEQDRQIAEMATDLAVPDSNAAEASLPGENQAPAAADGAELAPLVGMAIPADPGARRPIVPIPLQRENIRATVEVFTATQWHKSRYHALRTPVYLVAYLFWAFVGTCRAIAAAVAWWWLAEQRDLRSDAVITGNSREWRALHKEAKETRLRRGLILLAACVALAITGSVLAAFGPWWSWALSAAATTLLLARAGRPDGHRVISAAVVPPQYQPITWPLVVEALGSLNIRNIDRAIKDGRGITRISDPYRDGPGWAVQLDLPPGVTAGHIIARRPELASGLRRPLSATWPEAVPAEHEGRLMLWVGFHDISRSKPPRYPLAKAGAVDIFAGVPFATDPRGRPIMAPLFEVNWLIGASPGQGKTNTVRVLTCGAALDPITDIWVHEQAGKGDLEMLAQVCHRYCSGLDDEAIAYAYESIRKLRADLEFRSALFKRLPKHLRPHGKINRDIALAYFRLRPVLAVFDEAQNIFLHPEFGADAAVDLAHVMRLGRAYGIMVEIATQRPDKDSVPTIITGIVTARYCLKVPDWQANDMILGTGAYKAGYNAVIFRAKTDAGLGWLKADGDPQIARTYYLSEPDAERICARARALRERAGVLSGYALGVEDDRPAPRDILGDVLEVIGTGNGMHWAPLADALAERFPDRWADATAEAVSSQCKALGVQSVDVKVEGYTTKGARRVLVERAADQR